MSQKSSTLKMGVGARTLSSILCVILSSPDRCRPCQWLFFLTGLIQAAVAVRSEGIGGVNRKVFRDRMPLCDLQDASRLTRFTIFRSTNRAYDRHRTWDESRNRRQIHLSLWWQQWRLTPRRRDGKVREAGTYAWLLTGSPIVIREQTES